MASSSYDQSLNLNSSNPPRYSKSQMYLFKILHIISSIPPFPNNNNTNNVGSIDLNLRFSSITNTIDEESDSSTKTTTNTSNNNNNNNNNSYIEEKEQEEEAKVDDVASKFENDVDTKTPSFRGTRGDSNCLDLLIEAARVLSEKNESDSEEEKRIGVELMSRETTQTSHEESVKKPKERWVVVDLYEREPVVRSKRGRNQVLPWRFRDSVVEPLKRKTRNQRLSSTSNAKKRLLH